MSTLIRRVSYALAILAVGTYAVFVLRGPQGIPALIGKWEEVRQLEQDTAELQEKIRQKKERIRRLADMRDELELEMRKELMQLKPGEKLLILPDNPESNSSARP